MQSRVWNITYNIKPPYQAPCNIMPSISSPLQYQAPYNIKHPHPPATTSSPRAPAYNINNIKPLCTNLRYQAPNIRLSTRSQPMISSLKYQFQSIWSPNLPYQVATYNIKPLVLDCQYEALTDDIKPTPTTSSPSC